MAPITLENFQERWSALEADILKDTRIAKVQVGSMGGGTIYYSDGWLQDCVIEISFASKEKEEAWATYLANIGKKGVCANRPDTSQYYIGIAPNGSYKTYTSEINGLGRKY